MKYTIALLCTSLLLCSIAASADTINVSGKSSVVFVLQHAYHSSGEPQHTMTLKINGTRFSGLNANSGTVFNVKARPGANFRIRIENFNKLKYTVKETPTATPEPKLQLPSIFTKAFDGLIPNPPTPAGQSLGTSTVDFDKIMNKFYQAAQMTANFMRTVQKAKSDAETEEDQDKFLDDLSDAGAMYLGKDNPDWYKPDNLGKLIDNYSKGIEIMKDQLYMAHQQAPKPTVTQQYAIKTAQSILTEATTFQGQLDQVKQTLNAYATDYKNQIFTYISPKPTSFSSGKLNLKVEIFAQSETKQENAIYRFTTRHFWILLRRERIVSRSVALR